MDPLCCAICIAYGSIIRSNRAIMDHKRRREFRQLKLSTLDDEDRQIEQRLAISTPLFSLRGEANGGRMPFLMRIALCLILLEMLVTRGRPRMCKAMAELRTRFIVGKRLMPAQEHKENSSS